MADFGTVEYNGTTYTLKGQAEFTNRVLDGRFTNHHEASEGEMYDVEFSAPAIDGMGNEVTVYWMFEFTKGEEPEDLSDLKWSNVDRID